MGQEAWRQGGCETTARSVSRATRHGIRNSPSRAETPLPSFGQFDGVSSISTHVLHAKLNVCPVKQTQHQQQQQTQQQHGRFVRAGSLAFSKAKFLAFLQNVLANFISS